MTAESPFAPHSSTPAELKQRLEAERLGMCFLVFRDAGGTQQIYTLEDTAMRKITVGRVPDADVPLGWDPNVSGVHAEFERIGNNWALLDDGLSRNGSFVNGERLHGRHRLKDGDVLRFGQTAVLFRQPLGTADDATVVASDAPASAELSDQQRKVLVALCGPVGQGEVPAVPPTNREIADQVFLSVDAVKSHLRVLFDKFGVADLPQNKKRSALMSRALQSGAVSWRDLQ